MGFDSVCYRAIEDLLDDLGDDPHSLEERNGSSLSSLMGLYINFQHKTIISVAGPNGSGKSAAIKAAGLDDIEIPGTEKRLYSVNADAIAKAMLSEGFEGSVEELNLEAQRRADEIRERLLELGLSFVNETVGSHPSRVEFLNKARELGYKVIVLFVATEDPTINVERVAARVARGGHNVPRDKIVKRYERVLGLLPSYYDVSDVFVAFDNSRDNVPGGEEAMRLLLVKYEGAAYLAPGFYEVEWLKEHLFAETS